MILFRRYIELKQAIVNLKSGTSFRCVVFKDRDGWLILKSVEIMADRGERMKEPVDNEVLVNRRDVDFIQMI